MSFRTDDEILALADVALGAVGSPRCLFPSGILPLVGMTDAEAAAVEFPYDTEAYQIGMGQAFAQGKTSSCGVVTEIGWRYAGVTAPMLYESYAWRVSKGKYVIVVEQEIAKADGAWVSGIPWVEGTPLPEIGDAPIIGCKACGESWARGTTNTEHEYTVLCYDPIGGGVHHTIDGGQPGIKLRTRGLVEVWTGTDAEGRRTGELWASTVDDKGNIPVGYDGRPVTGRRFVGYTNVAKLERGEPQGPCFGTPPTPDAGTGPVASVARAAGKGLLVVGLGLAAAVAYLAAKELAGKRR